MRNVQASTGPRRDVSRELVAKLFGGTHALREKIRNARSGSELAHLASGAKLISYKIGKGDRRFAVEASSEDQLSISMQRLIAVEHGAPVEGLILD